VNKIIISNYQLSILTSVFVVGASPLIIPTLVASVAGRDSWLSIICAAIVGLLVVWVNIYLAELHPGKTFVEFTQQLLGQWLGGFVSIGLIMIEFLAGTDVIWYVGDFFTTVYMTGKLRYSPFTVTKEINVGVIFSRLEALIVIVWLVVSFFAVFIYIYSGILGLSQVLKLKNYKRIVIPVLLIVTVYSVIVYKDVPYQLNWDTVVRTPAALAFGFVLPLVLLVISLIRKKLGTKNKLSTGV